MSYAHQRPSADQYVQYLEFLVMQSCDKVSVVGVNFSKQQPLALKDSSSVLELLEDELASANAIIGPSNPK
jgi:hypothetical protein